MSEKGLIQEIIDKATLANIAAFVIVVGGFFYAVYTKDSELVKSILLIGLGYFFGKM